MALPFLLDPLFCQEEHLGEEEGDEHSPISDKWRDETTHFLLSSSDESEEEWGKVFSSLAANELKTHPNLPPGYPSGDNPYLRSVRREAVEWVAKASAYHGFSALTVILAVNNLDRCFLSSGGGLRLQEDKPWMGQLSAVACLSLAAKVEETHVPLLLDLQAVVEDAGYMLFDAKIIKRMELLVLSSLHWRMNPVTPFSFIRHVLPKLNFTHWRELWNQCEAILLSVIADWRWVKYPPSVWAVAALVHAMGQPDQTHQLINLLNLPKERVEGCYQLILESIGSRSNGVAGNKRKLQSYCCAYSSPPSPSGVLASTSSYDSCSSGESWTWWPSSVSSSPDLLPPFKRPNLITSSFSGGGD